MELVLKGRGQLGREPVSMGGNFGKERCLDQFMLEAMVGHLSANGWVYIN